MFTKERALKIAIIVLALIGGFDLIRGYMHTLNIWHASGEIAQMSQTADTMWLMHYQGSLQLITSLSFLFWYGGKSKPLSKNELNDYIKAIKDAYADNDISEITNGLEALCQEDDGKFFYMVNLMKFKTEYNEELGMTPLEAHKRYSQGIVKELFKRAGHPIYLGKVTGSFIKDSDSSWDEVGIIRYRSR